MKNHRRSNSVGCKLKLGQGRDSSFSRTAKPSGNVVDLADFVVVHSVLCGPVAGIPGSPQVPVEQKGGLEELLGF